MPSESKIIIVGAGPVGLTAALILGRSGLAVTVLEAEERISPELRASTFHPPTLDMMAPYGVTARMLDAGLICPTWQVRMHPSGERAVFDLSVLRDETDYPYRLQCEQSKYCEIVLKALSACPNVTVRFSTPVIGVTQTDGGADVRVAPSGAEDILTAAYVIGADGARSVVRQALGITMSGDMYPETTILATTCFPFHERLEGLSNVSYCWKPEGTFSLLRLPDVWRVSLYPREGQTVEEALQADAQQDLLHDIVADAGPIDVLQTRPYRIHRRLASAYRNGRVFLVGDAAHVNSPSGGMGMNGGIHDALNLTAKLGPVINGTADERILADYDLQRRTVTMQAIQGDTIRNKKNLETKDEADRARFRDEIRAAAADPAKGRQLLRRIAMLDSLERAASLHATELGPE